MDAKYLKSLIDEVSAIEVKSEAQQTAKYELIECVSDLFTKNEKLTEKLKMLTGLEYNQIDEHTFVGIGYYMCRNEMLQKRMDEAIKILKGEKDI